MHPFLFLLGLCLSPSNPSSNLVGNLSCMTRGITPTDHTDPLLTYADQLVSCRAVSTRSPRQVVTHQEAKGPEEDPMCLLALVHPFLLRLKPHGYHALFGWWATTLKCSMNENSSSKMRLLFTDLSSDRSRRDIQSNQHQWERRGRCYSGLRHRNQETGRKQEQHIVIDSPAV